MTLSAGVERTSQRHNTLANTLQPFNLPFGDKQDALGEIEVTLFSKKAFKKYCFEVVHVYFCSKRLLLEEKQD